MTSDMPFEITIISNMRTLSHIMYTCPQLKKKEEYLGQMCETPIRTGRTNAKQILQGGYTSQQNLAQYLQSFHEEFLWVSQDESNKKNKQNTN